MAIDVTGAISILRRAAIVFALTALTGGLAQAAPQKALRFWNLTGNTITELYLAPPGTTSWSANLCLSDPDHGVDPDERLGMTGIEGGTYDVRIVDKAKRACVFHNVTVKSTGPYAFSVSEDQMKTCSDK
jgi:hypothetical protein